MAATRSHSAALSLTIVAQREQECTVVARASAAGDGDSEEIGVVACAVGESGVGSVAGEVRACVEACVEACVARSRGEGEGAFGVRKRAASQRLTGLLLPETRPTVARSATG